MLSGVMEHVRDGLPDDCLFGGAHIPPWDTKQRDQGNPANQAL